MSAPMNSPPSGGFPADEASQMHQFEHQYKQVLRELAEKEKTIDELYVQLGAGGAVRESRSRTSACRDEETNKALLAKDLEIERLRGVALQAKFAKVYSPLHLICNMTLEAKDLEIERLCGLALEAALEAKFAKQLDLCIRMPIYPYACISVSLYIHIPIYPYAYISVCGCVASRSRHSSQRSSCYCI